jgi:hypothetical protein
MTWDSESGPQLGPKTNEICADRIARQNCALTRFDALSPASQPHSGGNLIGTEPLEIRLTGIEALWPETTTTL